MNPAISIIVPVYKTEKYIRRCLESLVNQTFHDIEIICVNDGSPDNAPAICEEYAKKDSRIKFFSQTNQGVSAARNTGLLQAKGEYIQFCDPDDFYDLTMCEKMYNAIITSDVDLAVVGAAVVYEGAPCFANEDYYHIPFQGIFPVTDETFTRTNVFLWNKIFKKSIIDQFGISFPYGLHYEDASFLFKYLMVSKTIYYINALLYNYVCRPGSIMVESQSLKPYYTIEHVYIINDVARFMEKHGLEKQFEQIFIWMARHYTHLACIYGGEEIYAEAFEAGSALFKNIDFNSLMYGLYHRDDVLRLYALKKHDRELYFSVDRFNAETENFKQQLAEQEQIKTELATENQELKRIQTLTYDKSFRNGLFIPALRSCFLFPWYIYKTFCMVYNQFLPKRSLRILLRSYFFFPYYILKVYLTLMLRRQSPEINENKAHVTEKERRYA